jgi:mevalonate kinase
LELKVDGAFLRGRLALYWTGNPHDTPDLAKNPRDYAALARASLIAREAAWQRDLVKLAQAVRDTHAVQLAEGMTPLDGAAKLSSDAQPLAAKYCGGGYGGYAVYLFKETAHRDAACKVDGFRAVEPYLKVG